MSVLPDGGVALVRLIRNDVIESVHAGHVVVCDTDGSVVGALGNAERMTYVRSSVKPFQALATMDALAAAGVSLDVNATAIACASHDGTDDHQIEAARLLAEADLDESALQCPPAWPRDPRSTAQQQPERLAHNCSGKHASFLYATVCAGDDPGRYLALESPLQQAIRERLADACSATPEGPGIDGCGAPAWLLSLRGLATGFARLGAGATPQLERIRSAMTARPLLVGGTAAVDSQLMRADARVVAKRGAEAVFAAGVADGLGVAVKITDGGHRADGPVAATLLQALGLTVPDEVRRPSVLGGGQVQGALEVDEAVAQLAAGAVR